MSELDFDELDKAVSTLMGDVPKVEPSKADNVKTLSIASTLTDESRPSLAKLDSELTKVNGTTPSTGDKPAVISPTPLATRRGGRFMDVVHPSSDMKGVVKPATSTSRQGVTIEPSPVSSSDQADRKSESAVDVVKATDESVVAHVESVSDDESATNNDRDAPANDWPDPLDMTAYTKEPDTNSAADVTEVATLAEVPVMAEMDDSDTQPLMSPFLPDAKVEKRPLGGAPADEVKKDDENQDEELSRAPAMGVVAADDSAVEDAAEQLPADPLTIERPLPPELQSDLMAIETDGGTTAAAVKAPEEAKTPAVAKIIEKTLDTPIAPTLDKKPMGEPVAAASGAVAATLTGPTSIPQQYHEEPTTSDQTNGAIYDTDSYHQPLAHPAKTKSGWLWIIWILLLLMVGGGGAVALYFLGII